MRYIHVFVSSTFSDMHRERDLLHQIAGLINRDIFDQGYQVILRDLRYGIDTANMDNEIEVEKKVLAECFEAINQCQLFVLLLGDRYGSVFEDLSIPQLYMPDQELEGKSVTHLEVDYGMLKIDPKHIIAFERMFSGDSSTLPLQYQENEIGITKKQKLKDSLGCYIDPYSAEMKDGKFVIDEYYFLKHGQGMIQQMVLDYIQQQNQSSAETTLPGKSTYSETLSDILIHEIDKKTVSFPERYRELAKTLILLRIQGLLHQQDYDKINQIGSNGNAILEYRKSLIANLPGNLVGLLQELCKCIAIVVEPELDVFEVLLILASAQNTALRQMGGISIRELMMLIKRENYSIGQTLDEWLDFRYENSGAHSQQSPAQRALACFLEKDILLSHINEGYLFKDNCIAELLCENSSTEIQERIWVYIADIFWYLPDTIGAWAALLDTGRYDLALSCLEAVALDERFTNRFLDCVAEVHAAEQAVILLKKFLYWMVEQSVEEVYIFYGLEMCRWVINRSDDEVADQQYQSWIVPLYQTIHNHYYDKHSSNLTITGQYFLWYLYNEFEVELSESPQPLLSAEQMADMEDLDNAVFELFRHHDLSEPEQLREYLHMANILTSYLSHLDQFIRILRIYAVQTSPSWHSLCKNLVLLVFGNQVLEQRGLMQVLSAVSNIRCDSDFALSAIEDLNQNLVEYAYRRNDDALCISALHIVYDIVLAETKLRRTVWCSWSRVISCDVIDKLYRLTDDTVVQEIAILQDELMFAEPEELSEIDASSLREVEKYYNELNKTIHRTSD